MVTYENMNSLQRHTGWRGPGIEKHLVSRVCLLVCCLLLLLFSSLAAQKSPEEVARKCKPEVRTFRINIQRLQEGIAAQRQQFTEALNTERNLLAELEELDKRLAEQTAKLQTMEDQKSHSRSSLTRKRMN